MVSLVLFTIALFAAALAHKCSLIKVRVLRIEPY